MTFPSRNGGGTTSVGQTAEWPRFADLPEPRMVGLFTGNGSGTKVFQGMVDGHPQLHMLPGYPLMYLYPVWEDWKMKLAEDYRWETIIDAFFIQHASVLDTRRIPGHDGLTSLGTDNSGYLSIDEEQFRAYLLNLVHDEPITFKTFLIAVHYSYTFSLGEDVRLKKLIFFHIHVPRYVPDYLLPDFPEAPLIGAVRDPRSNLHGRYQHSNVAVDDEKLNRTDAILFRRRTYYYTMVYLLEGLEAVSCSAANTRVFRHEDLYHEAPSVMDSLCSFLDIERAPCLDRISFGGQEWAGGEIYGGYSGSGVNPSVVSDTWKEKLSKRECFLLEGLLFDYMVAYGYKPIHYLKDDSWDRLRLRLYILLPVQQEWSTLKSYLSPSAIAKFIGVAADEAVGRSEIKDYSFNAYYRHKWTNEGLHLDRPRWYVVGLLRNRARSQSGSVVPRFRRRMWEAIYISVQLVRFAWAPAGWTGELISRWRQNFRVLQRRIGGRTCLPKVLN